MYLPRTSLLLLISLWVCVLGCGDTRPAPNSRPARGSESLTGPDNPDWFSPLTDEKTTQRKVHSTGLKPIPPRIDWSVEVTENLAPLETPFDSGVSVKSATRNVKQGLEYRSRRDFDRAIACFEAVTRQEPQSPTGFFYLGETHLSQGDSGKALPYIDICVRLAPNHPTARYLRGIARLRLNNHADALADFDSAQQLGVDHAKLITYRASCLLNLRRFEPAIAECNRGLTQDPNDPETYFVRSMARAMTSQFDEAAADHRKAVELGLNADLAKLGEQMLQRGSR
jgi:tetratricopeptide (TPR) repeat protein